MAVTPELIIDFYSYFLVSCATLSRGSLAFCVTRLLMLRSSLGLRGFCLVMLG